MMLSMTTQIDPDFAADGDLMELSAEEAWEKLENFVQCDKKWDNPVNVTSEQELASLRAQANKFFRNKKVWVKMPSVLKGSRRTKA
ncbi:hypothetical protein Tco_0111093 [Tanacetum coccineum]